MYQVKWNTERGHPLVVVNEYATLEEALKTIQTLAGMTQTAIITLIKK